jgi:hypothetical protein
MSKSLDREEGGGFTYLGFSFLLEFPLWEGGMRSEVRRGRVKCGGKSEVRREEG